MKHLLILLALTASAAAQISNTAVLSCVDSAGINAAQRASLASAGKYAFDPPTVHVCGTDTVTSSVTEYVTPKGEPGYTINLALRRNGKTYVRVINVGPEKHRSVGTWTIVPDPVMP